MSVKNVTIKDASRFSHQLPDPVKLAIADVVIEFAQLEADAEDLIWQLTGLAIDDGRLLTAMDTKVKFDLLKVLVERRRLSLARPPLPDSFWTTAHDLRNYRNQIVHGLWVMVDDKTPAAASFRLKDQNPKRVVADGFDIERMEAIFRQTRNVRRYLKRLRELPRARPQAQIPPSHARSPRPEKAPEID